MEINIKAYIKAGYIIDVSLPPSGEAPEPDNWILTTGQWNDAGEWDDTKNWKDS